MPAQLGHNFLRCSPKIGQAIPDHLVDRASCPRPDDVDHAMHTTAIPQRHGDARQPIGRLRRHRGRPRTPDRASRIRACGSPTRLRPAVSGRAPASFPDGLDLRRRPITFLRSCFGTISEVNPSNGRQQPVHRHAHPVLAVVDHEWSFGSGSSPGLPDGHRPEPSNPTAKIPSGIGGRAPARPPRRRDRSGRACA